MIIMGRFIRILSRLKSLYELQPREDVLGVVD